jgi:hypothetical protein
MRSVVTAVVMENLLEGDDVFDLVEEAEAKVDVVSVLW